MAKGYVKLWRSFEDWEWYNDIPCRLLFLYLMINVNRKHGNFQGHTISPGEVATSLPKMASKTGLSDQQVRTALSKLKSTGDITDRLTGTFRIVSLENWEHWQGSDEDQQGEQQGRQQDFNRDSNSGSTGINNPIGEGEKGRSTPIGVPIVPTENLVEPVIENTNLFGPDYDPKRQTIMRESAVADWAVFERVTEVKELTTLGVDMRYYHGAVMRWSDNNVRLKKHHRTGQGWVSSVVNWLDKDRAEGKLRMMNGATDKDERLLKFLKIGKGR